jgi:ParB family chromosome partitioning protein
MERRLGRGLGSLLGGPEATDARGPRSPSHQNAGELSLASIDPNPFQPRRKIEPEALEELSASIRAHGVLQPVVVRPSGTRYQLIAGERRWRAARLAGLQAVPAVIRQGVGDQEMLELALVENVQRAELSPIERALGYRQLMEGLSLTQEAVATKVGLKRATVTNHLRLLDLPEPIQDAVGAGLIGMGHARALLGLESQAAAVRLLAEIVRDDLSVREVERRVRDLGKGRANREATTLTPVPRARAPWVRALETRLRTKLGCEVSIEGAEGGRGKIAISFFSRDELDRLCERIAPKDQL